MKGAIVENPEPNTHNPTRYRRNLVDDLDDDLPAPHTY